ncbi:hypothetical protein BCR41DRAFT_362383 [Lobosporangium transversale]|uniref:Uncharacterized protein n=1 Tax=Lobosporangium transversale TaxID=64571 RepID=A0A1Y2G978_9FUNG|nr:hypothetical protein BCR41DRAFT_362383 [Lobosporangium transversale]ORZ04660.1 hypothetical protein BCR41DRAFT_362383 [Lobosporangium transversale]|eukprot:XP_021876657.1 hypothetical protein BCR41DRAFT_362383 [Lobosporangium transversale]
MLRHHTFFGLINFFCTCLLQYIFFHRTPIFFKILTFFLFVVNRFNNKKRQG